MKLCEYWDGWYCTAENFKTKEGNGVDTKCFGELGRCVNPQIKRKIDDGDE